MASMFSALFVIFLLCVTVKGDEPQVCSKLPNAPKANVRTTIRNKLKCNYDPKKTPKVSGTDRVALTLYVDRQRVEHYRMDNIDLFFSSSYLVLRWMDARLKWKKNDYNNCSAVHMSSNEIWTPNVLGARDGFIKLSPNAKVTDDGQVIWCVWWSFVAQCNPAYRKWGDARLCQVSIQLKPFEEITVDNLIITRGDSSTKLSSWQFQDYETTAVEKEESDAGAGAGAVSSNSSSGNGTTSGPRSLWDKRADLLSIKFIATRNTAIMDAALFSPAAVVLLLLLASTWIPCASRVRLALLASTPVLELYLLRFATRAVPNLPGRFPEYVLLYRDLLLASGLAFLLWCVSYMVGCRKILPGSRLQLIVAAMSESKHDVTRALLLIPSNPTKVRRGTMEAAFLSIIVDRIAFTVLLVVFTTLIVTSSHSPEPRTEFW